MMNFIYESTGRKKLRVKTREVTRDVMKVLRNEMTSAVITSIPEDAWDPDSFSGSFVLGVLLGPYSWDLKIDTADFGEDDELLDTFSVSVGVTISPETETINIAGASIAVDEDGDDTPGLDIRISLPRPIERLSGNDLRDINVEVRNTIAHELEHLTQNYEFKAFDRGENYYSGIPTDLSGGDMFNYLIQPKEVAAHVMGYAAHTKSWDEFTREIEEFLKGYQISGQITRSEADQVSRIWADWALKHLRHGRFRR